MIYRETDRIREKEKNVKICLLARFDFRNNDEMRRFVIKTDYFFFARNQIHRASFLFILIDNNAFSVSRQFTYRFKFLIFRSLRSHR